MLLRPHDDRDAARPDIHPVHPVSYREWAADDGVRVNPE
jgi:hypothetical protein